MLKTILFQVSLETLYQDYEGGMRIGSGAVANTHLRYPVQQPEVKHCGEITRTATYYPIKCKTMRATSAMLFGGACLCQPPGSSTRRHPDLASPCLHIFISVVARPTVPHCLNILNDSLCFK